MMTARSVFFLFAAGCASVQQEDVAAWRGATKAELQTQPLFSTLPKSVEQLDDGSELWTYSNCKTRKTAVTCTTVGAFTTCGGGNTTQTCCHNQFLLKDGLVVWYRPVGRCYMDCSTRPASRPCTD